jgi:hypothetical protein
MRHQPNDDSLYISLIESHLSLPGRLFSFDSFDYNMKVLQFFKLCVQIEKEQKRVTNWNLLNPGSLPTSPTNSGPRLRLILGMSREIRGGS